MTDALLAALAAAVSILLADTARVRGWRPAVLVFYLAATAWAALAAGLALQAFRQAI